MDLILSALLLASFVIGVDVLVDGGADLATRFGGLFRAPDLAWPAGVQEADIHAWVAPGPDAAAGVPGAGTEPVAAGVPGAGTEPAAAVEIEDGGPPVPSLARIRRR